MEFLAPIYFILFTHNLPFLLRLLQDDLHILNVTSCYKSLRADILIVCWSSGCVGGELSNNWWSWKGGELAPVSGLENTTCYLMHLNCIWQRIIFLWRSRFNIKQICTLCQAEPWLFSHFRLKKKKHPKIIGILFHFFARRKLKFREIK